MRLPVRPVAPFVATVCACLVCACLVAACGGSSHHRTHTPRKLRAGARTVEIYSSLPLVGPAGAAGRAVQRGIRLAWIQANRRAGDFLVRYRSLSDARTGHGSWAASLTAANARQAAVDPAAMVYIGDFDSGATRVSLPILNQAGIPQISPWSPYVGFTRAVGDGVSSAGDPGRYYPTSVRSFFRLAPDDAVQAAALLSAAHDDSCTRMAVLRSAGTQNNGAELSGLLDLEHARFDVRIVSPGGSSAALVVSPAAVLRRDLGSLRALLTECVAYVGAPSAAAVSAIAAIHAALPRAELFGSDRLCQAAFGGGAVRRELVVASGGLLQCTYPALPSGGSAPARFAALWQTQYGGRPPSGPWAAYGYEAMRLAIQAIAELGPRGDQRSRLIHALFGESPQGTFLGSYGFSSDGDSTVRAYGLWQVRAAAPPRLERVMEPSAA